jgi:lysophospholipase L1-like esterase
MKRLGVNFLILAFTLTILGIFLEWGTRILVPHEKEINKDWVQQYIQYNRDGFRDREFVIAKPRNKFRILVIGDSQTFGHGIEKLEDTFPKQLEKLLNQGTKHPKFEVLSFARPGWNTAEQLQYVYKKGFLYQPDLILLNFFHNDLPPSPFLECDSKDWEILPEVGSLIVWFHRSSFYHLVKFRINRLMEKTGYKLTYEDCRRSSYQSRSWDMEEIYLDTLHQTARMKNIHFMISVIPIMFKLDKNYPFTFAHNKLKRFCSGRNIFCVDLYEEGFQGKNEDDFIVSRKDRHFNARGAKLSAEILFEKIKPLKNYQDLNRWHLAYDLEELLKVNGLAYQFNSLFPELDISPINIKNKSEEMFVSSHQGNYFFSQTRVDSSTGKKVFLRRIILERDGKMVKKDKKTFNSSSGSLIRHEIIDFSGRKIIQTERVPISENKEEFSETKKTYVFAYHSKYRKDLDKFFWELEIEENTRFYDPLSLESALFIPDLLSVDRLDTQKLRSSLEFYIRFPFYSNGNGASYVKKLLDDILHLKPFKKSVQFVEDFKKRNKEL